MLDEGPGRLASGPQVVPDDPVVGVDVGGRPGPDDAPRALVRKLRRAEAPAAAEPRGESFSPQATAAQAHDARAEHVTRGEPAVRTAGYVLAGVELRVEPRADLVLLGVDLLDGCLEHLALDDRVGAHLLDATDDVLLVLRVEAEEPSRDPVRDLEPPREPRRDLVELRARHSRASLPASGQLARLRNGRARELSRSPRARARSGSRSRLLASTGPRGGPSPARPPAERASGPCSRS